MRFSSIFKKRKNQLSEEERDRLNIFLEDSDCEEKVIDEITREDVSNILKSDKVKKIVSLLKLEDINLIRELLLQKEKALHKEYGFETPSDISKSEDQEERKDVELEENKDAKKNANTNTIKKEYAKKYDENESVVKNESVNTIEGIKDNKEFEETKRKINKGKKHEESAPIKEDNELLDGEEYKQLGDIIYTDDDTIEELDEKMKSKHEDSIKNKYVEKEDSDIVFDKIQIKKKETKQKEKIKKEEETIQEEKEYKSKTRRKQKKGEGLKFSKSKEDKDIFEITSKEEDIFNELKKLFGDENVFSKIGVSLKYPILKDKQIFFIGIRKKDAFFRETTKEQNSWFVGVIKQFSHLKKFKMLASSQYEKDLFWESEDANILVAFRTTKKLSTQDAFDFSLLEQ